MFYVFYTTTIPLLIPLLIFSYGWKKTRSLEKVNTFPNITENQYINQDLNMLGLNQDIPEYQIWDSLYFYILSKFSQLPTIDKSCHISSLFPWEHLNFLWHLPKITPLFLKKVLLTSTIIWNNDTRWRLLCQNNLYLVWKRLEVTRVPGAFEMLRKLQVSSP